MQSRNRRIHGKSPLPHREMDYRPGTMQGGHLRLSWRGAGGAFFLEISDSETSLQAQDRFPVPA